MEEILKEILTKITNLERKTDTGLANLEGKMDTGLANLEGKMDTGLANLEGKMNTGLANLEGKMDTGLANLERKTEIGFAIINERIELMDRGNKEEFRQLNRKIDGITVVVAKTMEDITELKTTVEKQDVEIRVIKGGAANA